MKRAKTLSEGWLERQILQAKEDIESWPPWIQKETRLGGGEVEKSPDKVSSKSRAGRKKSRSSAEIT